MLDTALPLIRSGLLAGSAGNGGHRLDTRGIEPANRRLGDEGTAGRANVEQPPGRYPRRHVGQPDARVAAPMSQLGEILPTAHTGVVTTRVDLAQRGAVEIRTKDEA